MSAINLYRLAIVILAIVSIVGLDINPFRHLVELTALIPFGAALTLSLVPFSRYTLVFNFAFSVVAVGFYLYALMPWFIDADATAKSSSTSALDFVIIPSVAISYGFLLLGAFVLVISAYDAIIRNSTHDHS